MIQVLVLVVLTLSGLCQSEWSPMMGNKMCMSHCSYVCMASAGRIETCPNLLSHSNTTLSTLPDMAACLAATASINDCFLQCGCQCTRCGVCLMKNLKTMSAMAECKAKPDPMKCISEKKSEALKKCN
jgi:hypothetical protein